MCHLQQRYAAPGVGGSGDCQGKKRRSYNTPPCVRQDSRTYSSAVSADPPQSGARPSHRKSTCLEQFTLGPCVVQIWSRTTRNSAGLKSACSAQWWAAACTSLGEMECKAARPGEMECKAARPGEMDRKAARPAVECKATRSSMAYKAARPGEMECEAVRPSRASLSSAEEKDMSPATSSKSSCEPLYIQGRVAVLSGASRFTFRGEPLYTQGRAALQSISAQLAVFRVHHLPVCMPCDPLIHGLP